MITLDDLQKFKNVTEIAWSNQKIDSVIYGFQVQAGTKWLPGLTEAEISEFETVLGFSFPDEIRLFLSVMNGADTPQLNVYGNHGTPYAYAHCVYSYPRDLETIKEMLSYIAEERDEIAEVLAEAGIAIKPNDKLLPIYYGLYIVCSNNPQDNVILSIHGSDAILWAKSLESLLSKSINQLTLKPK